MSSDPIAVVTGSSRGAGKGIAIALGQTGATVYVPGRSTNGTESPVGGTVTETAANVTWALWRTHCGAFGTRADAGFSCTRIGVETILFSTRHA